MGEREGVNTHLPFCPSSTAVAGELVEQRWSSLLWPQSVACRRQIFASELQTVANMSGFPFLSSVLGIESYQQREVSSWQTYITCIIVHMYRLLTM